LPQEKGSWNRLGGVARGSVEAVQSQQTWRSTFHRHNCVHTQARFSVGAVWLFFSVLHGSCTAVAPDFSWCQAGV